MKKLGELWHQLKIYLFPNQAKNYVAYALFLEKEGRENEALSLLEQALREGKVDPDFSFFNNLGIYALRAYLEFGDTRYLSMAQSCFSSAYKLEPENELVLWNLAEFWTASCDYAKALKLLAKLSEIGQESLEMKFKIAMAKTALKQYEEAKKLFFELINLSSQTLAVLQSKDCLILNIKFRLGYLLLAKLEKISFDIEAIKASISNFASAQCDYVLEDTYFFLSQAQKALLEEYPLQIHNELFPDKAFDLDLREEKRMRIYKEWQKILAQTKPLILEEKDTEAEQNLKILLSQIESYLKRDANFYEAIIISLESALTLALLAWLKEEDADPFIEQAVFSAFEKANHKADLAEEWLKQAESQVLDQYCPEVYSDKSLGIDYYALLERLSQENLKPEENAEPVNDEPEVAEDYFAAEDEEEDDDNAPVLVEEQKVEEKKAEPQTVKKDPGNDPKDF